MFVSKTSRGELCKETSHHWSKALISRADLCWATAPTSLPVCAPLCNRKRLFTPFKRCWLGLGCDPNHNKYLCICELQQHRPDLRLAMKYQPRLVKQDMEPWLESWAGHTHSSALLGNSETNTSELLHKLRWFRIALSQTHRELSNIDCQHPFLEHNKSCNYKTACGCREKSEIVMQGYMDGWEIEK